MNLSNFIKVDKKGFLKTDLKVGRYIEWDFSIGLFL